MVLAPSLRGTTTVLPGERRTDLSPSGQRLQEHGASWSRQAMQVTEHRNYWLFGNYTRTVQGCVPRSSKDLRHRTRATPSELLRSPSEGLPYSCSKLVANQFPESDLRAARADASDVRL